MGLPLFFRDEARDLDCEEVRLVLVVAGTGWEIGGWLMILKSLL